MLNHFIIRISSPLGAYTDVGFLDKCKMISPYHVTFSG